MELKDWIASIAVSIVALATVIGIIWKFASWKMGVDKDIGSLGKGTDEDRSTIKSFMKEIRNDIKDISKRLPPPPAVAGQSPIRLTDHGEELATDLQAKAWAKELAPSIVDEVRGKRPFEIDEFCNTYVTTRLPGELGSQGCRMRLQVRHSARECPAGFGGSLERRVVQPSRNRGCILADPFKSLPVYSRI